VTEVGPGLGFTLRDPFRWKELAALARDGERLGYRALFLPEVGARDVLVALGALAGETNHLTLASGIVPMTSRLPNVLAMAAATVHERSGGRFVLGLGTGPAIPGALARLGELVRSLRRLFSGEAVELDGRQLRLGLELETPPPIWISALGPKAVSLAGELADGVLLNWCTPERVARARDEIAAGAQRVGRDPAAVTIAAYVRGCFDEGAGDDQRLGALKTVAGEYASYPAYARQFAAMGLGSEAEAAAVARAAGRPLDVPDALVRAVCLVGDAEEATPRLQAFRDAGADLPIVYPVPAMGANPASSVLATLEELAPVG
jgi:alkanesulfonate monooxygenase SsuD/methylene tetrahydromethanopterin reductase-like flavin-dependent oxidoreductase (luciferase family)